MDQEVLMAANQKALQKNVLEETAFEYMTNGTPFSWHFITRLPGGVPARLCAHPPEQVQNAFQSLPLADQEVVRNALTGQAKATASPAAATFSAWPTVLSTILTAFPITIPCFKSSNKSRTNAIANPDRQPRPSIEPWPEWCSLLTLASDDKLNWFWHGDWLVTFIEKEKIRNADFSTIQTDAG